MNKDPLLKPLGRSSRIFLGLIFFGAFIVVGLCIFISDDPAFYVGLMIGAVGPLGALGFHLLFAGSQKREGGLLSPSQKRETGFSPFTLRLCAIFLIIAGSLVIMEGQPHSWIAFSGAVSLFALAHQRTIQRKRNKSWFESNNWLLSFSYSRKREAGLLSSSPRKRETGFSPFTLRLCAVFLFFTGIFLVILEGQPYSWIAFGGAVILLVLARKRSIRRKRNKAWFESE